MMYTVQVNNGENDLWPGVPPPELLYTEEGLKGDKVVAFLTREEAERYMAFMREELDTVGLLEFQLRIAEVAEL